MSNENEYQPDALQEKGGPGITLPEIDPKTIWPDKAAFSKWLSRNPQPLSDLIGRELLPLKMPRSVQKQDPDLRPDLFLRDSQTGKRVVVLNQLEPADHHHLMKVTGLTVHYKAGIGIWISPDPNPHFVTIINIYNELSNKLKKPLWFLVRVRVYDNGDGTSMVRLSTAAGPSGWVSRGASWALVG